MSTVLLSPRTRVAASIGLAALGLGVLADQLMRAVPWGLNLTVCALALVAAGAGIARRYRLPVSGDAPWLALTACLAAVAFVRRDSITMRTLDVGTLGVILALTLLAAQGASVRQRGISAYLLAGCVACGQAWFGVFPLLSSDVAWHDGPAAERWRRLGAVGMGLLLAAPLLIVFGGLFVSADATFASLVSALRFDIGRLTGHVVLTLVCAALAAGTLRGAFLGTAQAAATGEQLASPAARFITAATVLGALDLLFLVFVAVQVRWLFGGMDVVQATTGLTLAEYARRGFFELVTAAALVLPVLLAADWATRREGRDQETSFRALATVLVLLVGVLLVSALQRMLLYVGAFGLTELRLYTTAFMAWLAGVFAWLGWTVLRGARPRFAFGALLHGLAVVAGLHLLNPDALIVRVDAGRARAGAPFDVAYTAGRLSADAVPALLEAVPHLDPGDRSAVAAWVLSRWGQRAPADWRSWNWAEARVRARVHAQRETLVRLRGPGCPPATPACPPARSPQVD
jgi:Domain of unknown function (DUF4153)